MLRTFMEDIGRRSPLQRKALQPLLENTDERYWSLGDDIFTRLENYLRAHGGSLNQAAEAYLGMCQEILTATVDFQRTGRYQCRCQADAHREVYSNESAMREYLVGLAVSQFLWRNHYLIYTFFLDELARRRGTIGRYLEIGPGHGVYLAAALRQAPHARFLALDISPAALRLCQEVLPYLVDGPPVTVELSCRDALQLPAHETFDWITVGEVIEHLDDPRPLLRRLNTALAPEGVAFLSTCANCPTKDHVYLFQSTAEIQALLADCGLAVVAEQSLPLHGGTTAGKQELVNYAAVVRRAS